MTRLKRLEGGVIMRSEKLLFRLKRSIDKSMESRDFFKKGHTMHLDCI